MPDVTGVVSAFGRLIDTLSPVIAQGITKAIDAFDAHLIDSDELHELLVGAIMTANAYARGAADVHASVFIKEYTGQAPRPTGRTSVIVPEEQQRLHLAVGTVLAGLALGADIQPRLTRLGTSEVEQAAQGQITTAYENAGITGWRRELNPGACPLCTEWAAAGVLPTSVTPLHHAGCKCTPVPVIEEG